MFEASAPFAFFDYFRVPYTVSPAASREWPAGLPVRQVRAARQATARERTLFWFDAGTGPATAPGSCNVGRYRLRDFTFAGHVAGKDAAAAMLAGHGSDWHPADEIACISGSPASATWQDSQGNVFLPFDPGEVMLSFWSESYQHAGRTALPAVMRQAALRGYYALRPALPRPLQLRLRRAFTRVQGRSSFPAWPVEDSLHDCYDWLFDLVTWIAEAPVPYLDLWPEGKSWAFVLTHDVETAAGCADLELLRAPERERGFVSSWNFVGERYTVADETVEALRREGCEIGVHGLRHDGRDLGSRRLMQRRLPAMRTYAERWGAVGFRSPATQRQWELMPLLGFEYDSSYSDTDPYEPQPGGCCSYLPYFNENLVELPITVPQDHSLFAILQQPSASLWISKAQHIRRRCGMVLVLTHPDYARDPRLAAGYASLLDTVTADGTVWHAVARDVAEWWRQRAASAIRRDDAGWTVTGPAAGRAGVRFTAPRVAIEADSSAPR